MSYWSGRRVLVTGGSGFIGSHLCEMLLAAGAEVSATASSERSRDRFDYPGHDQVHWWVGDLEDPEFCSRAIAGQDQLMQVAAKVSSISYNADHPASVFRNNLSMFMNCIEAARKHDVPMLVTSSACVYPRDCSIPTPESEGMLGRPDQTNEGYGWAKRMEEFLADAYVREHGMHIHVARPYNAYGPRDKFDPKIGHVIPALIRRVFDADDELVVWGDGTATRSFLYATDFARGLMAVTEKSPGTEAINLGAGEEVSIREIAELIVELSGRDLRLVFDDSKPSGQPRRCCDTRLAEQLLGFRAETPLRDGLQRSIDWFVANRDQLS